jgi:methionyl-tRNA formyltransferase
MMKPLPRLLFFGTACDFSYTVLTHLLGEQTPLAGVVVASPHMAAPIEQLRPQPRATLIPIADPYLERALPQLAWEYDLPVFGVSKLRHARTRATLAALDADLAVAACFPWRVPAALLAMPRHGFWNLHPAMLPLHRGSAPLFWVFQAGGSGAGVTLHRMDADFDTGPIIRQRALAFREGIAGDEADNLCAQVGAELLLEALHDLAAGTLSMAPQPPGGSYEPWPDDEDFALDPAWPAWRAFVFMRGTADWGRPFHVRLGATTLLLEEALSYAPEAMLGVRFTRQGDVVDVQFRPGVLRARVYE